MGRVLRFLLVGLALPAALARAQRIELIDCGETWKYFRGTADPSPPATAWTAGGFDGSAWQQVRRPGEPAPDHHAADV